MLVSEVRMVAKPSPLIRYCFTATSSSPLSQENEKADLSLVIRRKLVTGDGGLVSGVGVLAVADGVDQTGIFVMEGLLDGTAAEVRETPGCTVCGTAVMPLKARGTAITVAPIPRAANNSICQCRGTR